MALPITDRETRLLGLIARAEPRLRRALLQAVTVAVGTHTLDELEVLIVAGLFDRALEQAIQAGIINLADEATAVFVTAGQSTSTFLAGALEITVSFDQVNQRAVTIMQGERLRLIREFAAEQRRATRSALVEGIREGLNPRDQARNFRNSIGLTERQEGSVRNFRRLLSEGNTEATTRSLRDRRFDRTIRRAIREGRPLTEVELDRMTDAYRRRALRHRSEVIARTESLRAVHQANDEAYDQAIESGDLREDQLVRTWHTARDPRVRDSHSPMNGQRRRKNEPFVSGAGSQLRYPGDSSASSRETVQCRCSVSTRIAKL